MVTVCFLQCPHADGLFKTDDIEHIHQNFLNYTSLLVKNFLRIPEYICSFYKFPVSWYFTNIMKYYKNINLKDSMRKQMETEFPVLISLTPVYHALSLGYASSILETAPSLFSCPQGSLPPKRLKQRIDQPSRDFHLDTSWYLKPWCHWGCSESENVFKKFRKWVKAACTRERKPIRGRQTYSFKQSH